MPATIYLHWAATPYSWVRSGLYPTIIGGDGTLHRLHAYSIDLPAHGSTTATPWPSPAPAWAAAPTPEPSRPPSRSSR